MALPNAFPHPSGVSNPVTLRAWAALPAANAWDAAPLAIPCPTFWWARLYFTYQRSVNAVLGTMDYYYALSPFSADALAPNEAWFHGTLYAAGDVVACAIAQSGVQQEFISYCSTSANAETFISPPIHLGGCVERLRVHCRQAPNQGAAGTAEVIGLFYT
jgi:hypothetical protein